MKIKRLYQLFIFIVIICCAGCSAERNNIISKGYHNTTARYNAYFYALQQIEAIEQKIQENTENNYGRILRIYPSVDSTLAASYKENVDETIKMAGIAIERHKNSRWVDDSWILAGRARFYSLDYQNAIETYKYVNKHGKDDKAKHEALIRLIRTFTDNQEYTNALAVSDYLDKEKLNKKNKKLLYLTRAYYYQVLEDYDNMVRNLTKVAPMLKRSEGKARILFIIGQIYQRTGLEAEAYNYYKLSLSKNPEYELDFHARLNMAQVSQLKNSSDIKDSRKVFEKLLSDRKNKEFKDKIYYEWGVFEAKQNNLDKALELLKLASINSKSERQKGLAYYQQATIYYDSLSNYRMAQAYYDSTARTLPRDEEINFTLVDKRNEVLGDFVKYLNIIELNDSLLTLVQMDSTALAMKLKGDIEKKREEAEELRKQAEKRQSRTSSAAFFMDNTSSDMASTWYFDNPSSIAIGQNEFVKTWGNRPLVDFWRVSSKIEQTTTGPGPSSGTSNEESNQPQETNTISIDEEVAAVMATLPLTPEKQKEAFAEVEDALYHVGNIYSLALGEKMNAAGTFEKLLSRFPSTEHEPEVLYQLYLIYKTLSNDEYKKYEEKLLAKYPNSKFARLIENPNYTEESNATAEYQKKIYREAYQVYDTGGYEETIKIINDLLRSTEETYFTSNLILLKILAIGKTEDIARYQYELSEFIKKYPDSDVNQFAQTLLSASKNYEEKQAKAKGISFIPYFDQQHYFVIVYESENRMDAFTSVLDNFNDSFELIDLKTSNLILNDQYAMILVTEFKNDKAAMEYFEKFFESNELLEVMPNFNLIKFVISKDNFNIFYQSKALSEYLLFFEKFY